VVGPEALDTSRVTPNFLFGLEFITAQYYDKKTHYKWNFSETWPAAIEVIRVRIYLHIYYCS